MQRIRIGQIGVGHAHAAGKMASYRQSDAFEVVGVVEPDPQLRAKAERLATYADLPWMTVEQLLNVPGLQAVAVETEVEQLLPTAQQCVEAGMHIHLDKPAGTSLSHFRKILDLAARKHTIVQMGYMYRYNPGIVLLRDLLRRGWLGEPFELHAVMGKVVSADDRHHLARFSGGMMFELACHVIDLVVLLLGKPTAIQPFSAPSRRAEDGLNDNMLAVFEYPEALATVKTTALEVGGGGRRHLVLCGTEGTVHIQPLDNPRIQMTLSRPRSSYRAGYQEVVMPKYTRYVDDADDLARMIRGDQENDYSYDHDLTVQECVLRASGMPVDT